MLTPDSIVDHAREYLGTPFHFGGRLKGIGIDCGGLIACVVNDLGGSVEVPAAYTRADTLAAIRSVCESVCLEVPAGKLRPADILLFSARQMPGHCGLYTGEGTFIHAYDSPSVSEVVETPLDDRWRDRIARVYRYKELV